MAHHQVVRLHVESGSGDLLAVDTEGREIIIIPAAAFKQDRQSGAWMRIDVDWENKTPWAFMNDRRERRRGNALRRLWMRLRGRGD